MSIFNGDNVLNVIVIVCKYFKVCLSTPIVELAVISMLNVTEIRYIIIGFFFSFSHFFFGIFL
jgi:ABC-type multidrug transport system permease subunit